MTTKKLTPKQARLAEFLSEFNFKVTYQSRKKNDKADALTRKLNEQPANEEDERQEHRMQVLLPPKRIEIQPIKVTNKPKVELKDKSKAPHKEPANEAQPAKQSVKAKNSEEKLTGYAEAERHKEAKQKESIKATQDKGVEAEDPKEKAEELRKLHAKEPHAKPHAESEDETDKNLPTLPKRVKKLNRNDVLFSEICEYLANPADHNRPTDIYLRGSKAANGLLYKDNKLWVANDLRLDVIREVHDQPAVGHAGVRKTILLIQQHFFWPRMKRDIDQYIRNCHVCRRAKALRD